MCVFSWILNIGVYLRAARRFMVCGALHACVCVRVCDRRSQTPSSLGVCKCCPGIQPLSAPRPQSRPALRPPPASPPLPVPHLK